jgi:hypothetical protein
MGQAYCRLVTTVATGLATVRLMPARCSDNLGPPLLVDEGHPPPEGVGRARSGPGILWRFQNPA